MFLKICTWFGKKDKETECTCDKTLSGRPFVLFEVVVAAHNTIIAGPLHISRTSDRNLDAQKTTGRNVLRSVLKMFPYRPQRVQMLQPGYAQQHSDFTNVFVIRYEEDWNWPLRVLCTYESHFSLSGNDKSYVHWADENTPMWYLRLYTMLKWVCGASSQAHSFLVRTSSNRSLPHIWKRA